MSIKVGPIPKKKNPKAYQNKRSMETSHSDMKSSNDWEIQEVSVKWLRSND